MIYTKLFVFLKNVSFLSELARNVFGIDQRGDKNISAKISEIIVKVNYSFFPLLSNYFKYGFTAQRKKLISTG